MIWKSVLMLSLAVFLLAGCVGVNPKAAREAVNQNVAQRLGRPVTALTGEDVAALLQTNLTAQSAVTVALLNNHSLRAEFEEIGISQADLAQAARLPNIELAGSWRFPNRPPSAADVEYSVAGNLLDLLTLPARKKIAAKNLEQTKLEVADKVLQLAAGTQTAFYDLQAQTELMKCLEVISEVNDAAADLAQRQADAGNINDLELHNQQAPAIQSRLDKIKAVAATLMAHEELNRFLSLPAEQNHWQMADGLPPLPAEEPDLKNLETLAIAQRLDLAVKRAQMESLAAALALKKHSRFIPGAKLGVDSERTPDGQRVTGPTLDLELPIFDQGQPAVAKLAAEAAQARENYAALEVSARSEVREAQAALAAARAAAGLADQSLLPLRKQILAETLRQYNAMQKSGFDLLVAKEQEQIAEQTGIAALRDYWIARVRLERAVGGRLNPALPEKQP